MLHILFSKDEKFYDGASLITLECLAKGLPTIMSDISNFSIEDYSSSDQVFFLTNKKQVSGLAAELIDRNVFVFNAKFLSKERTKLIIQKCAADAGISTPNILGVKKDVLSSPKFPIYFKFNNHAQKTYMVETLADLEMFISNYNSQDDWYIEEAVDGPGRRLMKFYWVKGSCFCRDNEKTFRQDVKKAMENIAISFSLDVFSADFIISHNFYWCLDINPAPAFFNSSAARENFVKAVSSIQQ